MKTLEKSMDNVKVAFGEFLDALAKSLTSAKPVAKATTKAPDKAKAATKKDIAELSKVAKLKAGEILTTLGKPALGELLEKFGAGKFTELESEPAVFLAFMDSADAMLRETATPDTTEDDDLLGDGPESAPAKEYTLEDVKALLLRVNNEPKLGKDTTRQLLGELGVARLPELKADKFTKAVGMIEAVLKDVGSL